MLVLDNYLQVSHFWFWLFFKFKSQTERNKSASWSVGSAVWSHVYDGQSSQLPHGYWSPSHIMSAPASIKDVIMARVRTHPGLTMNPSSGSQSQSQPHSVSSHSHWPHQAGLLINHAQFSEALSSRTFNLHHLFICANLWSWAFPLQDDFVRRKVSTVINHMFSTAQRVWLFQKLSEFFKSTDWKHLVCYFSQVSVARKCQKSSQQSSLWSIHMV